MEIFFSCFFNLWKTNKLDVAVGRTDWDGLEDGFDKALVLQTSVLPDVHGGSCGSALIHWGNWLDQTPTRNSHAPAFPTACSSETSASLSWFAKPTTSGAERMRCHRNRSQRPLLLLEMQMKGWIREFPSRNKKLPFLNIWNVNSEEDSQWWTCSWWHRHFGISCGWVWTGAVAVQHSSSSSGGF